LDRIAVLDQSDMMSIPFELPQDIAACHSLLLEFWQDREQLKATVAGHAISLTEKDRKLAKKNRQLSSCRRPLTASSSTWLC
jgi:hypothetical protein